jgi:hypothetical protein
MMDSEKVMELAQAVSDANARLDAADDMQKQAYQDSCLAEEALLDYLGSVVTKVARDAEDDFDSAENMLDASAPAEEIETDGSAHVTIDPVIVIDATDDTDIFEPTEPDYGPVAENTHTIHPNGSMTANSES